MMFPSKRWKFAFLAVLVGLLSAPIARAESDPDPEAPPTEYGGSQPDSPLAEATSGDPADDPTNDTQAEESGDAPADPPYSDAPDGPPPSGF